MADDVIETNDEVIATYNYSDIEDGSGTVTYYLYSTKDSSGLDYRIAKNNPYSYLRQLQSLHGQTGNTFTFYTGEFNTPRVVEGTLNFNFAVGSLDTYGGPGTFYIEIKVYHYDGSTSTLLGTYTSPTETSSNPRSAKMMNGQLTLARTKFKRGVQIKMEITINNSGDLTNFEVQFAIDPQNRDTVGVSSITPSTDPNVSTMFTAQIPFRIDR